jgi:hypothetical protein
MKVTEHNITDWELNTKEITNLIELVKKEINKYDDGDIIQTYYATILGKLLILRHDCATSETGTEETTITDL